MCSEKDPITDNIVFHDRFAGTMAGSMLQPLVFDPLRRLQGGESNNELNAIQDCDYPPIIINSLTLFGFDETGITDHDLVKTQLIEGVQQLEKAGSDLIIIGCNTVHYYYKEMQNAVGVPIYNIIEETKKQVIEFGYKKVGLFSSESTNKLKLYQNNFKASGIEIISPDKDQQKTLNLVIKHIMAGQRENTEDIIFLKDIARDYLNKGAEAIVMGCTEIPLAINQSHTDVKLFDTIEIIVQSAVDYSLQH